MTRDDIIKLAREAGWSGLYTTYNKPTGKADWQMVKESLTVPVTMEQIERFAALAAAAEREACAKVCEDGINNATDWDSSYWDQACENRAAAIRARGQA